MCNVRSQPRRQNSCCRRRDTEVVSRSRMNRRTNRSSSTSPKSFNRPIKRWEWIWPSSPHRKEPRGIPWLAAGATSRFLVKVALHAQSLYGVFPPTISRTRRSTASSRLTTATTQTGRRTKRWRRLEKHRVATSERSSTKRPKS